MPLIRLGDRGFARVSVVDFRWANQWNFKGVHWNKRVGFFQVYFTDSNKKHTYAGRFSDPKSAARAYDAAVTSEYGEFAATNRKLGLL